jgi:hypothetical protein
MKFALCGDSFCDAVYSPPRAPYDTWPYLVSEEFGGKIICKGEGGLSLYHSYELFLKYVTESDYIIFCVTEPTRVSNRYRVPVWISMLSQHMVEFRRKQAPTDTILPSRNFLKAIRYYYDEIMSIEYHETVQKLLLKEIDEIVGKLNKKCIMFKNFGENEKDPNTYGYSSFCGFEPKHCVWGDIALNSISDIELLSFSKQDMEELKYGDKRHNHLNEQNNKNLSNFIIDVIKEDNFTPRKIKMDEYFKDI